MDERLSTLAYNLVNYSCRVKENEKVLISCTGMSAIPLVKLLVKEVYKANALPFVELHESGITRELLLHATEDQLKLSAEVDVLKMKNMDAFIGIGAPDNINELSDIPQSKLMLNSITYNKPVHTQTRVPHTKWVVLRYPTNAMAQAANTSLEAFTDFYFNVCNLDYKKMSDAMDNLAALMLSADKVHIKGNGTDITFSIKGLPVVKCDGRRNIPDGEIYTAPVKDSVNGYITYNTPSQLQGFTYENVKLTFENGKITDATANDTERIREVFNTDEGARYIGEFSFGVNPYILTPMNNTLFDEKITGSFHFTPGNAYTAADNGNRSAIHWDLVCIQRKEYGGGEIYFDDVLIRKDGIFTLDSLKCLNPENLI